MALTIYAQGQGGAQGTFTFVLDYDDVNQNLGLTCTRTGQTTVKFEVIIRIGQAGIISVVADSLADGARHIVAGVGAISGSLWTSPVTVAMIGAPPAHNTPGSILEIRAEMNRA